MDDRMLKKKEMMKVKMKVKMKSDEGGRPPRIRRGRIKRRIFGGIFQALMMYWDKISL